MSKGLFRWDHRLQSAEPQSSLDFESAQSLASLRELCLILTNN